MEKLKPMLWSVMKGYTKEQLVKDIVAGIIVAIIALPLSIALALASGVRLSAVFIRQLQPDLLFHFLAEAVCRLRDRQPHLRQLLPV